MVWPFDMLVRRALPLYLIFFGRFLAAQEISPGLQVNRIDSLIFYSNLLEAEKEADRLYALLSEKSEVKEYRDLKLTVMLQKAYIYARNWKNARSIETSLDVMNEAKEYDLPEKEYEANLMAATICEQAGDYDLCKKYLDKAFELYKEFNLEHIYSIYCIRMSSYYRFTKEKDAAISFAYEALDYARKYQNYREYSDAHLLLGILLSEDKYQEAVKHTSLAAKDFLERRDYEGAAAMYDNIGRSYLRHKEFDKALLYNDSALWVYRSHSLTSNDYSPILRSRFQIFDSLGNIDSAYINLQKYHDCFIKDLGNQEVAEIKKITEKYESDKKEAVIKGKNQQIVLIISLMGVISVAAVLLIRKNRKINSQNKIISYQLEELMRTLEQKQMLLSELQHRVKNNLQHVISILEIQKESVDFNNIDELIRGNQNRIHSMALLHKKLNVSENVNDVDLKRYVTELAELVRDSYDNHKKKINLNIKCDLEIISIEKALPLGLIIVELVSNSMKHAFKKRNIGIISIGITKGETTQKNKIYYADNGSGFDFNNTNEKGLGLEIIKGLIDQLDGEIETRSVNGFELTIYFN